MTPTNSYIVGLDLGQSQDPSALTILQRSLPAAAPGVKVLPDYAVPYLQRWPLGTSYTQIVADLRTLLDRPAAGDAGRKVLAGCTLAVDATGVGRAVVDLIRAAKLPAALKPITITAGAAVSADPYGGWRVPKKDLVAVLQVLLQGRRLHIDPGQPEAAVLAKELANFSVRITASAHEVFEAWREGTHDDLVLSIACAAWVAERLPAAATFAPRVLGGGMNCGGPTFSPDGTQTNEIVQGWDQALGRR